MTSDIFRTPDDRFEGLPDFAFEPRYTDLSGDLAGLRMHYIDEGDGSPVLVLHGEPTWSFLYRHVIAAVAPEARVVAPDLVGFGRSDKVTEIGWYSYERHTESIRQLVDQLDLTDITVVVQDWGGPIGLRVAVEDPDRFSRLVILNTGLFKPGARWPTPGFLAWRQFAEQNPDLPIGMIVQGGTFRDLPDEVVRAYDAPFPDAASKAGAAAFPLLVPIDADDPTAAAMNEVADALERWEKPVLVAFSDKDPIFPQGSGRRWAERLPDARFEPVDGGSHFLQEDRPDHVAQLVRGFASGTLTR